jgi:uncharacterized repeat protein (TIGR03803 family)
MDSSKSGSFSLLIAGTIASVSQPVVASTGGTISLPGGSSVTIPAGALNANSTVTLQLSSAAIQPTNALFSGVGTSLLMSFSPAVGGVASEARRSQATSNATSSTSDLTFVLQGGQGITATQLQNALGVLDVNDGTHNYFALPTTYNAAQNLASLQVDATTIEGGSTLQIGLTLPPSNSVEQSGNASLQQWDKNQLEFMTLAGNSSFCPTGPKTLVLIHGMRSSPQDTFSPSTPPNSSNSWSVYAESNYNTILAIKYTWWDDVNTSAQSVAKILNSLFDPNSGVSPCNYQGTVDIEAHSEGTIVALASAQSGSGYLTSGTEAKVSHIVLVAGPLDGTPMAINPLNYVTAVLNAVPGDAADIWMPASINLAFPFIKELQPYSSTVLNAQAAAKQNLTSTEVIAVGGDSGYLGWLGSWLDTYMFLNGAPNDGVIPVSSALPTDSSIPNLVRLVGNDPSTGDYPYPYNHTGLVDNPSVMPDILNALNGSGETSQVSLAITPSFAIVSPGQTVSFTATVANMLNPQLAWSVSGGTSPGTLASSTGTTVQYTAPSLPGGPFDISASVLALPVSFPPAQITVQIANPSPAISSLAPPSVLAGANPQTLMINGSGFLTSSTVTFNGAAHQVSFVSSNQLAIGLTSSDLAMAGTYPVVVTNPGPGGGTATLNFAVVPLVTISPLSVSVPAGSVQTFTATSSGGGTATWSVDEGATGGSITSSGIYTAPTQTGTYHVVATSSASSSDDATAIVNVVAGPSINTLHPFNHTMEGATPWSAPAFGSDGNLYGTTESGGDLSCAYISSLSGCGTLYKSDTSGSVTTLHSFTGQDGAYPVAQLKVAGSTFYGTTAFGGLNTSECDVQGTSTPAGCGTVFDFNVSSGLTSILSFGPFNSPLGVGPDASLAQDGSGILYGATEVGGNTNCTGTLGGLAESGCGGIFSINASGTPAVLHTFSGSEGAYPTAGLLLLPNGYFYGTTAGGGALTCSSYAAPGCGTIFQMTSSGVIKTLHSFTGQDGAHVWSPLILGSDGMMYGSTLFGGGTACSGGAQWQGCGTVFKIDTAGNFTPLHSFSGPDGAYPTALIQASDGYFYGTTEGGGDASCTGRYGPGCGTVFRMDTAGNVTVLYSFTGQSDGSWPESGVIQGADGNLYGTTAYGGTNDDGVIFRVSNLASLTSAVTGIVTRQDEGVPVTVTLVKRPHVALYGPAVPRQH